MKEVDIISKVVGRDTSGKAAMYIPGAGATSVNLDDYLLKKIWDSVFEIRTDSEGNPYLFEKMPFVTQYGITMYADGGDLNLPSIYAGLPIDGRTLIRDDNGVLMINPDIDLGGGLTEVYWNDIKAKPTFATVATSGKYADLNGLPDLSAYATTEYLTAELKKYVTLNTEQTIAAHKNFLNGLSVGGLGITKSQDDVIYIDANLVVRGGITMYAEGSVDIPSILDSLPIASTTAKGVASFDSSYFSVDSDGKVTLLAENVGLNETELFDYLSRNNYAKKSDIPSLSGYATETYVEDRLDDLINGAPAAYDTLKEIADVLAGNVDSIGDIITTLGTKADKAIKISAGTGLSGGGTLEADRTLSLATSGVTAGTYKSVAVDKYGRVTSGTNPTTLAGYGITDAYTKTKVDELLSLYVTLAGTQTITGEKNFTGGLKVNGSPIVYDATNKYWKLEGDLLVTGGVTQYGSDSEFTPSTIMDGVVVDNVTIKKNEDGALYFAGSVDGGVASSVHWDNVDGKPSWIGASKPSYAWSEITGKPSFATVATSGRYSDLSGVPTLLSSFTDDVVAGKYLSINGGELTGKVSATILYARGDNNGVYNISSFENSENGTYIEGALDGDSMNSTVKPIYITWRGGYDYKGGFKLTGESSAELGGYKIWHEGNFAPSNYLPLTGGKVSGAIQFTKIGNGSYNVGEIGVFEGVGLSIESPLAEDLENSARLPIVLTWRGGYANKGGFRLTGKDSAELDGNKIYHEGNLKIHTLTLNYGTFTPTTFTPNSNGVTVNIPTTTSHIAEGINLYHTKERVLSSLIGATIDGSLSLSNGLNINSRGTQTFNVSTISYDDTYGLYIEVSRETNSISGIKSPFFLGWRGGEKALVMTKDGNFGFGKENPIYKIEVGGTLCVDSDAYFRSTITTNGSIYMPNGYLLYTKKTDGTILDVLEFNESNNLILGYTCAQNGCNTWLCGNSISMRYGTNPYENIAISVASSGNVGIKRANPNTTLDVNGTTATTTLALQRQGYSTFTIATITNSATVGMEFEAANATNSSNGTHLPFSFGWRGGDVGMTLSTGGNLLVNGGITMYSDIRKKTKLQDVELTLQQIADAPLIEHYYNSDSNKTTHVGSIAQYWAGLNDWFCKPDNDGFYTMEIQNAALASAISIARELVKYESKTDRKIRLLKQRVKELEDKIEQLEIK